MDATAQSRGVLLGGGDPALRQHVTRCLRGSDYEVSHAADREQLLVAEARESPAVVLLDDVLPAAVETIGQLREGSHVPIVILTLNNEPIAAACLRAGADAVLSKPFSAELLIAQLDLLATRLHPWRSEQDVYTLAQLTVDFAARAVFLDSERIHLSAREFRLLRVLISNGGRVLTHSQLLQLTWGPGYEDSGDLLRGYIRNLRRKFRDDARRPNLIFTESQVGYWMPRADGGG